MKKILPDPHHHFDLPSDKTLTNAVSDGIVPIDHVVKITHYLMLAYNHCHRTPVSYTHLTLPTTPYV